MKHKESPNRFIKQEQFMADGRESYIVTVSGTYYDMGLLLGRAFAPLLVQEINTSFISLKRKITLFLNKRETFEQELDHAVRAFMPQIPLACKEEIMGIYDGCAEAGHPLTDPLILEKFLVMIELGEQECTLFATQPPFTEGHTYQLRDLDYYKNFNMNYIPMVTVRIPQDETGKPVENAYAAFDFLPNISGGVSTGINEHGVVFSQSRGPFLKRFSFEGMPIKNVIQQILSKTNTAAEAVSYIRQHAPATAHFVIISDPLQKKESLQLVFMGPDFVNAYEYDTCPDLSLVLYDDPKLRFYEPLEGMVYWTDMVGRKVNNIPEEFIMSDLHQLLQEEKPFSIETGLNIARRVGNDITFLSALFDSTTLEAWVAFATRKTPAHNNSFLHFDLKKYFSYKNDLL